MSKTTTTTEEEKSTVEFAAIDFGDFEIHVKHTGAGNRKFISEVQKLETKYVRRDKMVEQGKISKEGAESLLQKKMADTAAIYADYVIVGWKGAIAGEKLPEYNRENVIKIFSDKENDLMFGEVMRSAMDASNFQLELDEAEIKN